MIGDNRPPGRLRAAELRRPFHVTLVEPEIPPNTGNIARLCAATCCPLHLVGPLGFSIDEHAVRRAGLDYWHLVQVERHETLDALESTLKRESPRTRSWLLSARATRSYLEVDYRLGDNLVFGKESSGLGDSLLSTRADQVIGIPTLGGVRSLNLANAVAIVLFEALRQVRALTPER
jgi:tRNA (cytidine/uridine-2'-O-)-methyltransferase